MNIFTSHIYYPTNIAITNSLKGTNQLAVELHQSFVTKTAAGFDMELIASGNLIPPPSLSIIQSGNDFLLSWPAANAEDFTLYTTTNFATGSWTASTMPAQTNAGQIIVTESPDASARFFRLQRP
jgi:hypothetical protein